MDKAADRSSSTGAQRLINLILQRFVISCKEAYEALVKVNEKNGGVLKGLKIKSFYKMVGKVLGEKKTERNADQKGSKAKMESNL